MHFEPTAGCRLYSSVRQYSTPGGATALDRFVWESVRQRHAKHAAVLARAREDDQPPAGPQRARVGRDAGLGGGGVRVAEHGVEAGFVEDDVEAPRRQVARVADLPRERRVRGAHGRDDRRRAVHGHDLSLIHI